jgi:hypothetical protein
MAGLGWKDMAIEQGLQNIARLIIGMHDEEILGTMTNIMLNQWKWSIRFDPFNTTSSKLRMTNRYGLKISGFS